MNIEQEETTNLLLQQKFRIEACVVRILKKNNMIQHIDLFNIVILELAFPISVNLKNCYFLILCLIRMIILQE